MQQLALSPWLDGSCFRRHTEEWRLKRPWNMTKDAVGGAGPFKILSVSSDTKLKCLVWAPRAANVTQKFRGCPGKKYNLRCPEEEEVSGLFVRKKKRLGRSIKRLSLCHVFDSQVFVKWRNEIIVYENEIPTWTYCLGPLGKPDESIEISL